MKIRTGALSKMLARCFIVQFLIAVSFIAPSLAKSLPPGVAGYAPSNVMLMLDTSGSMGWLSGGEKKPMGVATDSAGNIYVVEYSNHRVVKYDSSGTELLTWGSYGGGNGSFRYPRDIAVDGSGNVYVADSWNDRIQKFDTSGNYLAKWGSYDVSWWIFEAGNGKFNSPEGITVDGSGNIYVSDTGNDRVQVFNSSGAFLRKWGGSGSGNGKFNSPRGLAVDAGSNIYIADTGNNRVQKFDLSGSYLDKWGSFGAGDGQFDSPRGVAAGSGGNIYVADTDNHRIQKFDSNGSYLDKWGSKGSQSNNFNLPYGVAVDSSGNIIVADTYNHIARKYNTGKEFLLYCGELNTTPLDEAKEVIKYILSQSSLTTGVKYGLIRWSTDAEVKVNVSESGADQIKGLIDDLTAGGMTYLDVAINRAKSYFEGSDSPYDSSAECQGNFLIVISDGCWQDDPDSTAAYLYSSKGIKTFVVGFKTDGADCSDNYNSLSAAGQTSDKSPKYADNKDELKNALSDFISSIISSNFTFAAPVIMPSVGSEGDDAILQATFEHQDKHQWKGHLKKYALNDDGTVGALEWDAGEKLDSKLAGDRKIWTVGSELPAGLNNFHTDNLQILKRLLYRGDPSKDDEDATKLINFVRGVDVFDEDKDNSTTDERWKLADIYHSRPVVVGPPSGTVSTSGEDIYTEAYYRGQNGYSDWLEKKCGEKDGVSYKCSQRDEIVFAGSNGGILHAFDSSTAADKGEELWAFIPPSMLHRLNDMVSDAANQSNSIYGVDGSPVVKDIYYGNSWKTVLIGSLGRGGESYFALDITDLYNPSHLFTFYHDTLNKEIYYWGSTSDTDKVFTYGASGWEAPVDYPDYNISTLGESWSSPLILNVKAGDTRRWVAVLGGGYSGDSRYGSSLIILNLEDGGRLLKRVDMLDSTESDIINSIPSILTAVTADATTKADYRGAMLYFSDVEGKLWKVDMTDSGSLLSSTSSEDRIVSSGSVTGSLTQLFNSESTRANGRYIYHQVTPSIGSDYKLWNYYGTGDQLDLDRRNSDIKNRLVGVRDKDFPAYTSISSALSVSNNDLENVSGSASCTGKEGWYFDLSTDEKVTGKAAVNNAAVLFSRYTPSSDICSPGTARISEHYNYMCGYADKTVELGTGIPTAPVLYKKKIYIGISSPDKDEELALPDGWVHDKANNINLIIGEPSKAATAGSIQEKSWREVLQ